MKLFAFIAVIHGALSYDNTDTYLLMSLRGSSPVMAAATASPEYHQDCGTAVVPEGPAATVSVTTLWHTALFPIKANTDMSPGFNGYCQGYSIDSHNPYFDKVTDTAHTHSLAFFEDTSTPAKYVGYYFLDPLCELKVVTQLLYHVIGGANDNVVMATDHALTAAEAHGTEKCTEMDLRGSSQRFASVKMKKVKDNKHITLQLQGPYNSNACTAGTYKTNSHAVIIPIDAVTDAAGGALNFGAGTADEIGVNMSIAGLSATTTTKTCEVLIAAPASTGVARYWSCDAAGALTLHQIQNGTVDCSVVTRSYTWTKDYMFRSTDGLVTTATWNNNAMCAVSSEGSLWMKAYIPAGNRDAWCALAAAPTAAPGSACAPASIQSVSIIAAVTALLAMFM